MLWCCVTPLIMQFNVVWKAAASRPQRMTALLRMRHAGGRSDTVRFASAERYTPATGTWSPAGELAAPLDSFAMAV